MSTFTLAISCLTTSNLPWFMDLTFRVPMQHCSLQHRILLLDAEYPEYIFKNTSASRTQGSYTGRERQACAPPLQEARRPASEQLMWDPLCSCLLLPGKQEKMYKYTDASRVRKMLKHMGASPTWLLQWPKRAEHSSRWRVSSLHMSVGGGGVA